jgi:hypothetical protein
MTMKEKTALGNPIMKELDDKHCFDCGEPLTRFDTDMWFDLHICRVCLWWRTWDGTA